MEWFTQRLVNSQLSVSPLELKMEVKHFIHWNSYVSYVKQMNNSAEISKITEAPLKFIFPHSLSMLMQAVERKWRSKSKNIAARSASLHSVAFRQFGH